MEEVEEEIFDEHQVKCPKCSGKVFTCFCDDKGIIATIMCLGCAQYLVQPCQK